MVDLRFHFLSPLPTRGMLVNQQKLLLVVATRPLRSCIFTATQHENVHLGRRFILLVIRSSAPAKRMSRMNFDNDIAFLLMQLVALRMHSSSSRPRSEDAFTGKRKDIRPPPVLGIILVPSHHTSPSKSCVAWFHFLQPHFVFQYHFQYHSHSPLSRWVVEAASPRTFSG